MRQLFDAIIRRPSKNMAAGERTFVARDPIDPDRAVKQHRDYEAVLQSLGRRVEVLDADDNQPDCAFVEDCAVALPGIALICRPGAESRRAELDAVRSALNLRMETIETGPPATIDGGDVLCVGDHIYVGRSCRTNDAGIEALQEVVQRIGYGLTVVQVHGCLHLKTACTALPDGSLVLNRHWIEAPANRLMVCIDEAEPFAANILLVGQAIIAADNQLKTNEALRARGFEIIEVDISEFQKAEGGVTCLSILIESD